MHYQLYYSGGFQIRIDVADQVLCQQVILHIQVCMSCISIDFLFV